ncbi:MAG: hypothetical protein EBQ94_05755 [Flavobacteriales bacterium]|nr:hypothetical protein [Flavobacteriales bacterium]
MKRVVFLAVLFMILVPIGYYIMNSKPVDRLPFINPNDLQEEMVDPEMLRVGQGHTIGNFSLKNQNNQTITQDEIAGKIFVAEYFFTTCKSICPIMNKQMQRVQKAIKGNKT